MAKKPVPVERETTPTTNSKTQLSVDAFLGVKIIADALISDCADTVFDLISLPCYSMLSILLHWLSCCMEKKRANEVSGPLNGEYVEAVIMRYDTRLGKYDGKPRPGGPRSTFCISSQVGCKMGCNFCATGSMGFKNNLSSGEILEQLVHASSISAICNVVFMRACRAFPDTSMCVRS